MSANHPSNQLIIRPYCKEDVGSFYHCVRDSVSEFSQFLPWVSEQFSIFDAESWVKNAIHIFQTGRQYDFVVEEVESGNLVGGVGLLNIHFQEVDLGYFIGTAYCGLGYATQAARLAIGLARERLDLKAINIYIEENNVASIKVAEKLGAIKKERAVNFEAQSNGNMPVYHWRINL